MDFQVCQPQKTRVLRHLDKACPYSESALRVVRHNNGSVTKVCS